MNWKRGLTRIYIVLWAALVILGLILVFASLDDSNSTWEPWAVWVGSCILLPAILLRVIKWIAVGFQGKTGTSLQDKTEYTSGGSPIVATSHSSPRRYANAPKATHERAKKTLVGILSVVTWLAGWAVGHVFVRMYGLVALLVLATTVGLIYVAWRLRKPGATGRVSIAVLLPLIALASLGMLSRRSQTPAETLYASVGKSASTDPVFANAFKNMTPEEAKAQGTYLSRRGLARLDDATLHDRALLMCKILPRLSEEACAAIARGTESADAGSEVLNAVASLEPPDQERWAELSMKAMRYQLLEIPAPAQDSADVALAFERLTTVLTGEELDAVLAASNNTATDAQAALAIRALYARSVELPDPHAGVLIRVLAGPISE